MSYVDICVPICSHHTFPLFSGSPHVPGLVTQEGLKVCWRYPEGIFLFRASGTVAGCPVGNFFSIIIHFESVSQGIAVFASPTSHLRVRNFLRNVPRPKDCRDIGPKVKNGEWDFVIYEHLGASSIHWRKIFHPLALRRLRFFSQTFIFYFLLLFFFILIWFF